MYCLSPSQIATVLLLGAIHSWACSTGSTTITPLPSFGGSFLQIHALNAAGQMTGFGWLSDGAYHAILIDGNAISDLGTLGGWSSMAFAINASGQVAGEAYTSGNAAQHAFLYSGGTMIDLGTLGGLFSRAVAVNDSGQAIGTSLTASGTQEAFLYSGGLMTSLGTLGRNSSSATAINASGSVAGDSWTDLETHAFLYTDGKMNDLGTLGGPDSTAYALNDSDVVVGGSKLANGEWHAFRFAGDAIQDLGTLGGTYSSASAINNDGQIIGASLTPNNAESHGFLYDGGTLTDLGTLGGNYSFPTALNNLGQIVGDSANLDGSARAFLWQNGTMTDLNTLLPADSGWVLISALFINDAGRIVGYGIYNKSVQWFALDPGSDPVNTSPTAAAGPDQKVNCQTMVTLDGTGSSDPDGDALNYRWSYAGKVFSTDATVIVSFDVGTHSITLTVTDPCGESSQDEVIVQVTDPVAPSIASITANPNELWPPNGQLTSITVTVAASDNCDGALVSRIVSITASEPVQAGEIQITGDLTARLAASKNSYGSERVYTMTVRCTDVAGNHAEGTVVVTVPRDKSGETTNAKARFTSARATR